MLLVLLPVTAMAQGVKIGFLSYDAVMRSMPEYISTQESLNVLRAQYAEETKHSEEEFNAKYEDFLDNLSNLATSIRRKRQVEMMQLMESNIRFREEAQRLIAQAEEEAMAPVLAHLNEVISQTARKNGYIVVFNTDGNACPYIDPQWGDDITNLVLEAIK